jgi:hypothetical protein
MPSTILVKKLLTIGEQTISADAVPYKPSARMHFPVEFEVTTYTFPFVA